MRNYRQANGMKNCKRRFQATRLIKFRSFCYKHIDCFSEREWCSELLNLIKICLSPKRLSSAPNSENWSIILILFAWQAFFPQTITLASFLVRPLTFFRLFLIANEALNHDTPIAVCSDEHIAIGIYISHHMMTQWIRSNARIPTRIRSSNFKRMRYNCPD